MYTVSAWISRRQLVIPTMAPSTEQPKKRNASAERANVGVEASDSTASEAGWLDVYLNRLGEMENLFGVTRWALADPRLFEMFNRIPEVLPQLARTPGRAEVIQQNQRFATFAKEQANRGFPAMFSAAIVMHWAVLEATLDDVVLRLLSDPASQLTDEVKSIKGSVVEYAASDETARAQFLFENLRRNLSPSLKQGVGRFEVMLNAVGLGGPVPDLIRKVLLEFAQVRNAILHAHGEADQHFLHICPWVDIGLGQRVVWGQNQLSAYACAANWYAAEVYGRDCRRAGNSDPDILASLQDVLDDIRTTVVDCWEQRLRNDQAVQA